MNGETLDVAVKMMKSDVEFGRIRFLQEAVMMGQFSDPNVLQIYGVIKDENANDSVGKCMNTCVCMCEPTDITITRNFVKIFHRSC